MTKNPNHLIHSTSPYLRQHAYNPVEWHPWGEEALQKAKNEDKPMIISIGYSACHWCHVMERESFENEEIARVMNDNFVCIKVDREERPDVDQLYMEAVQTMGINGGWPLNVFAMPDQRPFYGGTYFQPRQWMHMLNSIAEAFGSKRSELEDSANAFANALMVTDTEKYGLAAHDFVIDEAALRRMVQAFKPRFDGKEGGLAKAPKFPNPPIWRFLLTANQIINDPEVRDHLMLTLHKMAHGGIYDQIGGGFARYSVDARWFAPHFEKMLYDNAQLISLYSMAYQVKQDARFREVVYETIGFVRRELTSTSYGFYAALDADSEGEEGNFYIWKEDELDELLGADSEIIKKYYNVQQYGNWERATNILFTTELPDEFAQANTMAPEDFKARLRKAKATLLAARAKRERPGLDDKVLTSWNAMMIRGLVDAYHAFGEKDFLDLAVKNAGFIEKNLWVEGRLLRTLASKNNVIPGYLDDYAFAIDAYLALYQADFNKNWLDRAVQLSDFSLAHFFDPAEELFFYADGSATNLIARKKEVFDNVIPASNSVMAQALYVLGHLLERDDYLDISQQMLVKIAPLIRQEPQYLANWATLCSFRVQPTAELAVVGEEYLSVARQIQAHFIPNKVICAASSANDLPLLRQRTPINGQTAMYVCFNKTCKLPTTSVKEAVEQMAGR